MSEANGSVQRWSRRSLGVMPSLPLAFALAVSCASAAAANATTAATSSRAEAAAPAEIVPTQITWSVPRAPGESALIESLRDEGARFELGNGEPIDSKRAVAAYCEAARLGDIESQYRLGWMYANGSAGLEVSYARAAFYFQIAAEQGLEQARNMLRTVGGPTNDVPDCMRPPEPPAPKIAAGPKRLPLPEFKLAAPSNIVSLVQKIAPEYRVDPTLALAIIEAESRFDTVAISPKNAKGLMQLMPDTMARFNVRNPYDASQNIRGGVAYLRWLLAYFEGDVSLVAAAYNAGERAVERYRGVPPYLETRGYVARVTRSTGLRPLPFDASATPPSPQLPLIRQSRRLL